MLRVVPPPMKERSYLLISFDWLAKCPWPTVGEQEGLVVETRVYHSWQLSPTWWIASNLGKVDSRLEKIYIITIFLWCKERNKTRTGSNNDWCEKCSVSDIWSLFFLLCHYQTWPLLLFPVKQIKNSVLHLKNDSQLIRPKTGQNLFRSKLSKSFSIVYYQMISLSRTSFDIWDQLSVVDFLLVQDAVIRNRSCNFRWDQCETERGLACLMFSEWL